MNFRKIKFIIPGLFSAILFAAVIGHAGNVNFTQIYHQSDKFFFLCAAFAAFLQLIIATFRWRVALNFFNIRRQFSFDLKLVFIGSIANQTLPTSVAGDVFRAMFKGKLEHSQRPVGISVIVDKAVAFITLIIVFLVTAILKLSLFLIVPWSLGFLKNVGYWEATLLAFVVILIFCILKMWPQIQLKIGVVLKKLEWKDAQELVWLKILIIVILGLLSNMLIITSMYFCCLAMGLELSFVNACLLMPIILIGLNFPVTIGGWGLRELLFVEGLKVFQFSAEFSILASILFALVNLIVSLPGLYFLLSFFRARKSE